MSVIRGRLYFVMLEVFGFFPTPLMRVRGVLIRPLVDGLLRHFSSQAALPNSSSDNLSHTALLQPSDSPLLVESAAAVAHHLAEFGSVMLGEALGWSLKEMWVNILETGGRQAMHNHANSFISGVLYLTTTHPDSRTVFMRAPGGHDFAFKNDHAGVQTGPYNSDKWISPPPDPGDLTLFPSYLMHAVPPNKGERRVTMAFNAIPTRLDSWGYKISFSG